MDLQSIEAWVQEDFVEACRSYRLTTLVPEQFPHALYDQLIAQDFYRAFLDSTDSFQAKRDCFLACMKAIGGVYPTLAVGISLQVVFGLYALEKYGDQQQAHWIEGICDGSQWISVAWDEHMSGYALEQLDTQLFQSADNPTEWRINGQKKDVAFSEQATLMAVIVTDAGSFTKENPFVKLAYLEKQDG